MAPLQEKHFPHCWQVYGFSPVCVRRCTTMAPLQEKHFPHCWQVYGFSPVCMRRW